MKKKITALLVLSLVTLMFVGCGKKAVEEPAKETVTQEEAVDTSNTTSKDFKGEGYSFKLNIPNDWAEVTIPGTQFGYMLNEDGSNVNLVSESNQGYKLDKYAEAAFNAVKSVLNVSNIERSSKKIGKIDVEIGKYKLTDKTLYQVIFIKGDYANIFTLTSTEQEFDTNLKELENTLKTLEFIE